MTLMCRQLKIYSAYYTELLSPALFLGPIFLQTICNNEPKSGREKKFSMPFNVYFPSLESSFAKGMSSGSIKGNKTCFLAMNYFQFRNVV